MLTAARNVGPGLDGKDIYLWKIRFLELACGAISYGMNLRGSPGDLQLTSAWHAGVFLCIGTISTYTLIRKGLRGQRAHQALLSITLMMLFASTAHLALYIGDRVLHFPTLAAEYVDPSVISNRLEISQIWLRRITYFLSDIIVVWRAWVIWHENRYVHAALAVCILTTGVTSLTLAVFNTKTQFQGIHYSTGTQNFLGTFSLLVTNFFATALIMYYRQNIKKYINCTGNKSTKIENVLILLMETGGLYCTFWIFLMVGDYGYYVGFELESFFQPYISGIYPTVIIFMVSRQMMLSEQVLSNPSLLSAHTSAQTIRFAPPTVSRQSNGGSHMLDDSSVILNSMSHQEGQGRDEI
ncbi:hypothetical protein GGX14DRAFT_677347 [Mycena pura]|uniref:Uncharacterized protein n=1 Tax=Mycena pura TaxID=153505 RepID=A0AAD6Y7V0_9AGAR|nr:hypothetical protein GGX14DRAFT_677347 [Mycena pura]